MSKYIVVRNFYEGNGLHEEGNAFEHGDSDYIAKLLDDGNIAEVTNGGSESTAPLVSEVQEVEQTQVEQQPPVEQVAPPVAEDPQASIEADIALIQ